MPNKNIPDLPAGAAAGGYLLESYNTNTGVNEKVTQQAVANLFVQSQQTQGLFQLVIGGNTGGVAATVSSGTATLIASNNITLNQTGNQIAIIGPTQTQQTQGLFQLVIGGNTSGATASVSSGTATLFGGSNITLNQAGNAITINAQSQSVQTQNLFALIISGNTSGTTASISSGTATFVASDGITIQQSGNKLIFFGNTNTGAAAPTVNFFHNAFIAGTIVSNFVTSPNNFRQLSIQPLVPNGAIFPGNMTINTFHMLMSQSGSTATMSSAFTSALQIGLYTMNAGTLSLLNSVSTTWGTNAGNANLSQLIAGLRHITIHSSLWSAQPVLTQGHYWIAWNVLSTGVSCQTNTPVLMQWLPSSAPGLFGTVGSSTGASLSTMGFMPYFGSYTAASTSNIPNSIALADISPEAAPGGRALYIILNNLTSAF